MKAPHVSLEGIVAALRLIDMYAGVAKSFVVAGLTAILVPIQITNSNQVQSSS
jgi:hypothetical protein